MFYLVRVMRAPQYFGHSAFLVLSPLLFQPPPLISLLILGPATSLNTRILPPLCPQPHHQFELPPDFDLVVFTPPPCSGPFFSMAFPLPRLSPAAPTRRTFKAFGCSHLLKSSGLGHLNIHWVPSAVAQDWGSWIQIPFRTKCLPPRTVSSQSTRELNRGGGGVAGQTSGSSRLSRGEQVSQRRIIWGRKSQTEEQPAYRLKAASCICGMSSLHSPCISTIIVVMEAGNTQNPCREWHIPLLKS